MFWEIQTQVSHIMTMCHCLTLVYFSSQGGEYAKHEPGERVLKPHRLNEITASGDSADSDTSASSTPVHQPTPPTDQTGIPDG